MQQADNISQTAEYEQMVEFVEALIAAKYPGEPVSNHSDECDQVIEALNSQIEDALVTHLDETQQQQLNAIAEQATDAEAAFLDFFNQSGINFNQIVKDTMLAFANNFLGNTREGATGAQGGINE